MDYNSISNFLNKFKEILFKKEEVNNIIRDIVSNELSYNITTDKIKIKNNSIYIEGSPMLHNEIFLKKDRILMEIKNKINSQIFTDIK